MNSKQALRAIRRGFRLNGVTLIELLVAIILLILLLGSSFQVMTHARQETIKGLWLQDTIIGLRNGTRAVAQLLKKTSYPSTIVKSGTDETVVSYKDYRIYDCSGRLREIKVNPSLDFDLLARPGPTTPTGEPIVIFRFPVCTPETDIGIYKPGQIFWQEIVLGPSDNNFSVTPLGILYLVEREDSYQTQGKTMRAFEMSNVFSSNLSIVREKVLIRDVESVDVSLLSVDELRGIAVAANGAIDKKVRKRFLISLRVDCCHPKDDKTKIGDQCSVTSNIDVHEYGGAASLLVLSVTGSTAHISFNGELIDVGVDSVIGKVFKVTAVLANAIMVKTIPGNVSRIYYANSN